MRIAQVEIENFRGIRSMSPWNPSAGLNCLIGPGDSTKTTILDAIELCLCPRSYFLADDSDFFNLNFEKPIRIIVTLTDLPLEFTAVDRYGLFLRGWNPESKQIEDEPREGLTYALSIALVIQSSLEGRWSVYNERIGTAGDDLPGIRYRDAERIAPSRLGRYADRHFGWGRASVLSRIEETKGKFSGQLAEARRAAKTAFQKGDRSRFQVTATKAEELAKSFLVPVQSGFRADLDIDASAISSGGIALHDGVLPLRRLGTGSSRLIVAALQHAAGSPDISLIDELENGLEPHRIARLLRHIQNPHPAGDVPPQVFLTTHSPTVIQELPVDNIFAVRSSNGETTVLSVAGTSRDKESAQKHFRAQPEAFLAPRIVVGEGRTELGLLRGLDGWWSGEGQEPFAFLGVVAVDGGGKDKAPQICGTLLDLGYSVLLLHDTDEPPNPGLLKEVKDKGGAIEGWPGKCSTEERIFQDVPWKTLCQLIELAEELKGPESVLASIQKAAKAHPCVNISSLDCSSWNDSPALRSALGSAAKGRDKGKPDGWFKGITPGECIGGIVGPCLDEISATPLAVSLKNLRGWIDG